MKRFLFTTFFLFLLFLLYMGYRGLNSRYRPAPAFAQNINTTALPSATSTTRPTDTVTPSPTIDYQVTAIIAQQTADEARRVNAIVTAEFEAREFAKTQLAHDEFMIMEQNKLASINATASLAPTSFAATQTQQFISNTQIAQKNQIIAAQMTATQYAPTQMVVMQNAQNAAQFGRVNYIISMVAKVGIVIFMLGIVVFLFRIPVAVVQNNQAEETEIEDEPAPKQETIIQVKSNNGGGDYSLTRYAIPCTPDQFREFAENITQGKKTLAINQWEGKDTLFTRPVILRVRAWLRENRESVFVTSTDDGQLVPTDDLLNFLCGWLDADRLPAGYEFETPHSPNNDGLPEDAKIMDKITMNMRNHAHDNGGGGTYPASTVAS